MAYTGKIACYRLLTYLLYAKFNFFTRHNRELEVYPVAALASYLKEQPTRLRQQLKWLEAYQLIEGLELRRNKAKLRLIVPEWAQEVKDE